MAISFQEVVQFRNSMQTHWKSMLDQADNILINGRDNKLIPIYLTKYRIKSVDSIYLKTKRNNITDLNTLKDCAGLRVLCLFEADIEVVHEFIISTFKPDFELIIFKTFNLADKHYIETLSSSVNNAFPGASMIVRNDVGSGYKSIHYVFTHQSGSKKLTLEMQLRTLLQDVWGELEHSLAYKQGNIHPHIRTSFLLLAKDLETKDLLISHLKSIRDREANVTHYSVEKAGPVIFFDYEDAIIPDLFKEEPAKSSFERYIEFVKTVSPNIFNKAQIPEAYRLLNDVKSHVTSYKLDTDNRLRYFITMEMAYLQFWEGKFTDALSRYKGMQTEFPNQYVLHFRLGQIYFIMQQIVEALAAFDEIDKCNAIPLDYRNLYRIKTKVAYIYWMLGHEYIDFTLSVISEAEAMYDKHPDVFDTVMVFTLRNNLCSYWLDKFLISRETADYEQAHKRMTDLKPLLEEPNVSSNMLDTAAWFYYNSYALKTRDRKELELAKQYCERIAEKENRATHQLLSGSIHRNHIQEIRCTK